MNTFSEETSFTIFANGSCTADLGSRDYQWMPAKLSFQISPATKE